jgi:hypothetical protein
MALCCAFTGATSPRGDAASFMPINMSYPGLRRARRRLPLLHPCRPKGVPRRGAGSCDARRCAPAALATRLRAAPRHRRAAAPLLRCRRALICRKQPPAAAVAARRAHAFRRLLAHRLARAG